jgi:hypothetical protein
VTAGQLKIRDGMPVTVAAQPPPANAAAPGLPPVSAPAASATGSGGTSFVPSAISPAKAENLSAPVPKS